MEMEIIKEIKMDAVPPSSTEKAKVGVLVPTEDVVQALLDFFVEPQLPLSRNNISNPPSTPPDLSIQQSIANQIRAVVLLYNYYHRKQFPQLEFLDFESFCKVAVNAIPSLLVHLTYSQECKGDRHFKNLSVAEKSIMDACNISRELDALKESPSMDGWPISKVAVFLTDSTKEYCSLSFSIKIEGTWSLIEKNAGKWPSIGLNADKTRLQQLAMSAVEETTGIDPTELTILESHVAYSLSEEKTTACLFIMKCKSVNKKVFQVPIKDAIDRLQGPLVKKSCNSYVVTDVVEYFHLLPYAGMIADWFSREMLPNGSVLLPEGNTPRNDEPVTKVATGKSERSSGTCQIPNFPVLKKESGEYHVSKSNNIEECKASKVSHPRKARKGTSKVLVDNAVTKFSTESELISTKSDSLLKEDRADSAREAGSNDMDMDGVQASQHGSLNKSASIVESEQVLFVNDDEYVDCVAPCSPGGTRKVVGNSFGAKRMLDFRHGSTENNSDIFKTKSTNHGVGDEAEELMFKDLASIHFPTDDNPSRPLDSNDTKLLTEAILKVSDEHKSCMIRRVHASKKWGETQDIRVEILTRRNDLLGQSRKRQRGCFYNGNSEVEVNTCSGEVGTSDVMTNENVEMLVQSSVVTNGIAGSVTGCGLDVPDVIGRSIVQPHQLAPGGVCVQNDVNGDRSDIGLNNGTIIHETSNGKNAYAGESVTSLVSAVKGVEDEIHSPAVPMSTPEGIVSVGSVCFPGQYAELYKRIVEKFGDIIMPDSKEATLCSDMVSSVMKGFLEVVDSMLQVYPHSVDVGVLESWEMKLQFCEFVRLKVDWLRDHFERVRLASNSCENALIRELEGRVTALAECLETKRKQAVDIGNKLELVRAEEKSLLEQKVMVDAEEKALLEQKLVVDADLEAARRRQECFSISLF